MYYRKGLDTMTISVRLNDKDTELIKAYAEMNNISLSELVRNAILEKIEDEYDLECYEKAVAEYKKNPKTYTVEEVKKELGL
jgi:predicted DNA-binding protein